MRNAFGMQVVLVVAEIICFENCCIAYLDVRAGHTCVGLACAGCLLAGTLQHVQEQRNGQDQADRCADCDEFFHAR